MTIGQVFVTVLLFAQLHKTKRDKKIELFEPKYLC